MDNERVFLFVCGTCAESMEVDAAMRDSLIEFGCVMCGSTVTADAFDPQ